MNTFEYTLSTTQAASATISTLYQNLTGTNTVNFSLSSIDQTTSAVDKVIVTFYDDRELVFNRSLETSADIFSLSATTFSQTVESEIISECSKPVIFTLHREDGVTDSYNVVFTVFTNVLDNYGDINLIKTDYLNTGNNGNYGETLILNFAGDNPGIGGVNLLNFNTEDFDFFTESSTQTNSAVNVTVGFKDEFDIINSYNSHKTIKVIRTGDINAPSLPFNIKYRTRVGIGTAMGPDGITQYNPVNPGSQFAHISGHLYWECNDLRDIKTFTIPIIDAVGANLTDGTEHVLADSVVGVGTSMMPLENGYFYVDLLDPESCADTLTLGTSTLTAFINY